MNKPMYAWSNYVLVNIPVPCEWDVGIDNTWDLDKQLVYTKLEESFPFFDVLFVDCGPTREGADTYNILVEVAIKYDYNFTREENEMAALDTLLDFCQQNNWKIIDKHPN